MQRLSSRLKSGRNAGLAAAAAVFGIPATALSLLGWAGHLVFSGLAGAAIFVGFGTAYVRGRGQLFPRNLIDEAGNDEAPYSCEFCTEATLAEACELTRPHYGSEYVNSDQAETWRQANNKAFVHLVNSRGVLAASFGVIALSPSFTEEFIKGNVTDLQLKGSDVLDFDRSKRAGKLYISGVVVRDPDSHLGRKRAAAMLWVMTRYIEQLYGSRKRRTLYAIAVTGQSEQLMKHLGFTIRCGKQTRVDRSNLYCYELTPESWKKLRANVRVFGDSSEVCRCTF